MTDNTAILDFTALLLGTLGYQDDEFVAFGWPDANGNFRTDVMAPADAVKSALTVPETIDCYFNVNPPKGPARQDGGRGTSADVTRLAALVVDLDVKPDACPSLDVARAIVSELSILLGTRESATVESGGGLHAYWPIADGDITEGHIPAQALLRRWGRLVAVVADRLNVKKVDTVYDLARMMRLPGSFNNKLDAPRPVTAFAGPGGPLTISEVAERLDEVGIAERPEDIEDDTEVIAAPDEWRWADTTCPYVAKMIAGWATDEPARGRNPWLLSQKVRLACAHRLGCITEADYADAMSGLEARFTEIVKSSRWGTPREPKRLEFRDTTKCAMGKAARKSDEAARAELGGHTHSRDADSSERRGSFFDRDGLLAKDLADTVMETVTCGYGVTDERFYVYDNGVWTPDSSTIEATVAHLLGNRYRGAHARNVLDLIRLSPQTIRITCDPLPRYINVRNGMYDWAAGQLVPHSPDLRSTVQLPVEYQPDAQCPEFDNFIAQVLPEDCYTPTENGPGFIWEVLGYALYSGNPLHVAILLFGKGRNGKGTLIRLVKRMLGDRNCSTVGLHELAENRFRTATLFGKLANLAGDLDSRWLNNTAVFKAITGGDSVQGEHKYGAVFDFAPWALPFYSANKAFGAADSSEGWVARWVVIPFPTSFLGREDRGLDGRLQSDTELAGVFRRAAQALPALMARGRLPEPDSVREAKRQFVAASDAVRSWLDECCSLEPTAFTGRTQLYAAYRTNSENTGAKLLSAREFYARIEQVAGVWAIKRNGERGFSGISLKGQVGQFGLLSPASHGKKGVEPAPSAPSAPTQCPCGENLLAAESKKRGLCARCYLVTK